ncbi:LOW QUALITY PROTEIN: hypothetical protein Cgig2_018589 [Carnegiea gigantea]|uniref:Uncharacterized protein n=1 Tax=Carnegiea gigantea TaxID=171969 RepID=A0A9Q1QCJ1_9CARY|nr:LOW QUALITY PROTEIN: hypothetical protein Cgig2_018589 [Carnegiea gigantea]
MVATMQRALPGPLGRLSCEECSRGVVLQSPQWYSMDKLKHLEREIIPLVRPILGVDKGKARNLEVDFLVVYVPTTYNVILGRPYLHKVKAVIASYLLQLQFRIDDRSSHGILSIAHTIFIRYGWYEVYQLRIFILGTSLAVVFDVLKVCLKVVLLVKVIGGQELPKELHMVFVTTIVAVLLGLGRPFISSSGFGLCLDRSLFQLKSQLYIR